MTGPGPRRTVRVAQLMGMPISLHVLQTRPDDQTVDAAAAACWSELSEIDRVFSTYRTDSDVSRIRRGELTIERADPRVAVVAAACERARQATGGLFSPYWDGGFDPTGYVKGWTVEAAARAHLQPLVARAGVVAAGINAGGDMQLFTAADADWTWHVGIEHPSLPGRVIATVDVCEGAVATSGIAQRGAHILDPRTGHAALEVASATVVADSLTVADVWATAVVVAGAPVAAAVAACRSGIIVGADGSVRRWAGGVQIAVHDDLLAG
ncbi:FAD:protein FMN transferase [Microbacterium sp.]|uniref:FAD:protein FMN transferase n=1 Tax=Microbacterium sp. TaxID=51671 RepID=UPI003A94EE76